MKWIRRMLGKTKKKRHGFTLIELMVVLIIIAILAVAAVPTYMYFVHRAYQSEAAASLGAIKTAEIVYYAEHGVFTGFWGLANLGMTTNDFAQNKWFPAACFGLITDGATPTDFVAVCDGTQTGAALEVKKISIQLTRNSDIDPYTDTGTVEWCK